MTERSKIEIMSDIRKKESKIREIQNDIEKLEKQIEQTLPNLQSKIYKSWQEIKKHNSAILHKKTKMSYSDYMIRQNYEQIKEIEKTSSILFPIINSTEKICNKIANKESNILILQEIKNLDLMLMNAKNDIKNERTLEVLNILEECLKSISEFRQYATKLSELGEQLKNKSVEKESLFQAFYERTIKTSTENKEGPVVEPLEKMGKKEIEKEIERLIRLDDSGREFLSPKQVTELREREEALEDELDRRRGREPLQNKEEVIKTNTPPKKKFGLMTKIKAAIKPIIETVSRMASKLNFLKFPKNIENENNEEINLENTRKGR